MNQKFEDYKKYLIGKKVAAIGLGISNRPLLRYLAKLGVTIAGFDRYSYAQLKDFVDEFEGYDNVTFYLGDDNLRNLHGFDIIYKTSYLIILCKFLYNCTDYFILWSFFC